MAGYSEVQAPIVKTKSSRVIYIKKSKEGRGGGRDGAGEGGGGGYRQQTTQVSSKYGT